MTDPVALALIAALVTLGSALIRAWGRRIASNAAAADLASNAAATVLS
jgi:hypothetical protein